MNASGEFAWLYKSANEEKIVTTIQAVQQRTYKKEVYNGYGTNAVNAALLETLTAREKEMLTFFGTDLTAKEIAAKQKVSLRTIEGHKEKLKEKLQVRGSTGLAIYALIQNTYFAHDIMLDKAALYNTNPHTIFTDITA